MEKDTLITLEDGSKYALLDETTLEDTKYFFAVKVDPKTENPTTEYEVFEEYQEGEDYYMDILDDEELRNAILIDFTNNYVNTVGELLEESDKAEN